MAQQVCVVLSTAEREQLAAIVADRNPAAQTCGAGGHRARLGGSALGAAGGATHRRQSADGVAVATTLRRERGGGFAARQDPQTRQGADRGGNHGAGGGIDVHRAAAPGDPLDRPGNGQSHRHLGGFGAAHLAGPQTSAAPAGTFKRSRDPGFAAKLTDIVGLYVDPPAHAVVLSIDEKSQIQALDRTQPGLPSSPGAARP
jgi:hypothetical protein